MLARLRLSIQSWIQSNIQARRLWIRQILIASFSGATAWYLGDLAGQDGGHVAAIVSTLTVRVSLHRSIREGLGQIAGTILGALVALLAVTLFDFGALAAAMTIFLSFISARLLRLGTIASVNVPVIALIIIAPGLSESTVFYRIIDTFIGALVAIFFSYFSHPKTPIDRTYEFLNALGLKGAKILAEMSEGVAAGYPTNLAGHWLTEARTLVRQLPELRLKTEDAMGYSRWLRTGQREEAEKASLESLAIEHTLVQIRVTARTLFDASVDSGIADMGRKEMAVALSAASYALTAHIEKPKDIAGAAQSPVADLREAADALTQLLVTHSSKVERSQIVRELSIISSMEIIADSLELKSPALNIPGPEEKR